VRNFIKFIINKHFTILFLLIELLCFSLIVRHNNHQGNKFLTASNFITSNIDDFLHSLSQYFGLKEINQQLADENAHLRSQLEASKHYFNSRYYLVNDKLRDQKYVYTAAKVVNTSTVKPKNFFTIDKGLKQGINVDMGVVSSKGIAGIVFDVSQNYSTIMSIANTNFKVGAKLKETNYFGSLSWDGIDYRFAQLTEIPIHVPIQKGDTIVTNGYSAIYPEGIMIGTVSNVDDGDGENFYKIEVELATDYKRMEFVYIINDLYKKERLTLEKKLDND